MKAGATQANAEARSVFKALGQVVLALEPGGRLFSLERGLDRMG
jgi:hypothetical protein